MSLIMNRRRKLFIGLGLLALTVLSVLISIPKTIYFMWPYPPSIRFG